MNEQFTPELLAQARTAETPEALFALAAQAGITLTPKEAQALFDQLSQTGTLSDAEMENVVGGIGGLLENIPMVSAYDSCIGFLCKTCNATLNKSDLFDHDCKGKPRSSNCGACRFFIGRDSGRCINPINIIL